MTAPILPPEQSVLQQWMEDVELRLDRLEKPGSPKPVYACASTALPSAASYINCVLRVTDLNILAASDGTNWRRQDTGAAI